MIEEIFGGSFIALMVWMLTASFAVPALIGNVVGGFVLVTWMNHAQVVSGGGDRK